MHTAERNWIIQAQRGDAQAFSRLVEAYQVPVFNLCYRMLGNRQEAEDAAQETFLRGYQAIRRFDADRPFANWLLTIASRYCIDQLRRQRLQTFPLAPFLERVVPDPGLGPEATLSRQEEQEHLQALLGSLQPVDRAAVIMRYWHDLSYQDIAVVLDLSVSAVKSRLHRARKLLAERWLAHGEPVLSTEREPHGSPAF